jgi:2-methylisocitrate lyase-like PEP mutase family enzyme
MSRLVDPEARSSVVDGLAAKAEHLRSLHVPGRPLVLPNAWDAASARAVEAAGFLAVATASTAIAESLGYRDGEGTPVDAMFAAVARVVQAVAVPVTADIEAGYGLPAAELADRLLATGAVGCNLEDTDHRTGGLVDAELQAMWIAELRGSAGVPIVINARVDVHVRNVGPPEHRLSEAIRRARLYLAAGADCVYPIGVADEPTIAALVAGVGGPLNIYAQPSAPPLARLAELGVARVSYGPWLHRLAMQAVQRALTRIAGGEDPYTA